MKSKLLLLVPLLLIFIVGFTLRLYRIDNPIADWHSWRQADTAVITKNFVKTGLDPLYPRFNTLNSLNEQQIANPKRYFFAEFPLFNIVHYSVYTLFGIFSLEIWGRLVSVFFSSLTAVVLFFLVRAYSGKRIAFVAASFFAVLPFNIYYGRTILADPLHVFLSVLSLFLVTVWVRKNTWYLCILAAVTFTMTILTKPYGLVLLLPIGYLWFSTWGMKFVKQKSIYLFLGVALLPLLLWRLHISRYPEGMFASNWLFNEGNIRFTGAYFRWLIFDRMNRLIFATGGFVLFWLGILSNYNKKEGYFYYMWFAAVWVYFIVIAKGNVTHDYYQLPLVPIGCIFMAKGVDFLLRGGQDKVQRWIYRISAVLLVLFTLGFGWYEVRDFFNINNGAIITAGKYVDTHLPKDAIIIAPYQNDPAFLYQTNRIGFTHGGDRIQRYIYEGAQYLVSVSYDDTTNYWMKKCEIIEKNNEFVVVDLLRCNPNY